MIGKLEDVTYTSKCCKAEIKAKILSQQLSNFYGSY